MTRVKICGLMSEGDVALAVQAGADALGFVVEYPVPVPWNLPRERAAELVASAPPFVSTTAVVGGSLEVILEIAKIAQPNFLQLHGDETLEEIDHICSTLRLTGTKVLKALRIDVDSGEAMFPVKDPVEAAATLARTSIAGLVVDSKTASRPAGTGVPLNWEVAAKIVASLPLPLILAGGLNPENVAQAIAQVRPYAVDVISGVEGETGVKDERLAREFVRAVKDARTNE